MKTHKLKSGTELPILNLKGKDYLEVKYRLVWFREEHPAWSIETEFHTYTDKAAVAKATIRDESGRIVATSHKQENMGHFADFAEKAETGAIGRALALVGYGTQFCGDELDEGPRLVDSPVGHDGQSSKQSTSAPNSDPGEHVITVGKKYAGRRVKDLTQSEAEGYASWLKTAAGASRMSANADAFCQAVNLFYGRAADHAPDQDVY